MAHPLGGRLPGHGSSLQANFDLEGAGLTSEALKSFDRRHAVVTATVDRGMQGHFSLWPGSVLVRAFVRLKAGRDA